MKTCILSLTIALATPLFAGELSKTDTDAATYRIKVPYTGNEFGICEPVDRISVEHEWKYLLRYAQFAPSEGRPFSLLMLRVASSKQFVLASYDGVGLSYEEFDKLPESDKIRRATFKRAIDPAFAQLLYQTWAKALLRARFGEGAERVAEHDFYYLSTYGLETGYMCAYTYQYKKNATTGRIVELAALLRDYLAATRQQDINEKENHIRALCKDL